MASNFAASVEQRPQTTLEAARSSVTHGLDEVSAAIDRLQTAASAVMSPEAAKQTSGDKHSPPPLTAIQPEHSEVVNDLHAMRAHIEGLINRINGIRNRLEV